MPNDKLNTVVIESFIKQVKTAAASNTKEIRLPIGQAQDITFALALILNRLHGKLEDHIATAKQESASEVIQITMDGGTGWK